VREPYAQPREVSIFDTCVRPVEVLTW
jgi:hypothetical protein